MLLGMALGLAVLAGAAGLSRVPISGASDEEALLRLSWRTIGIRIEECRRRTEEELAALAAHMRTPEVCTGRQAEYALSVVVDGDTVVQDTLIPAGARRDRPIYVFEDVPLVPGQYHVAVDFEALLPEGYDPEGRPVSFSWEGEVALTSGRIALITLDEAGTGLAPRGP